MRSIFSYRRDDAGLSSVKTWGRRALVLAGIMVCLGHIPGCASGKATKPENDHGETTADMKIKAEEEYSIGYEYMKQKRYDDAIPHFQAAVRFWPEYYGAFIALAQAYRYRGEFSSAESTYAAAKRIDPRDTRAYEGMGVLYFTDLKMHDAAIAEYKQALFLDSMNTDITNSIAAIYAAAKNYDSSFAYYYRSLAAEPDNITSSFAVAKLYIEKGEPGKALDYLESLKTRKPEVADIRKQLGEVYVQLKKFDEAAKEYAWLIARYPDNSYYHLQLGFVYQKQKKYSAAANEYEEAHRLAPGESAALYYLADLNIVRAKYDEAETNIREALALTSDSAYAFILLGDIAERKGFNAKIAWEKKKVKTNREAGISALNSLNQAVEYYGRGKTAVQYAAYAATEIDRCAGWIKQIKEELWYIGVKP